MIYLEVVYKIPYRRAPRLAFRPSASREQRYLAYKLRSYLSNRKLKSMRDNIPEEHYKPLYYALFESHMTYCITVFGTTSKSCSEQLFKIQKHCIRILFGDLEKYLDKFRTIVYKIPYRRARAWPSGCIRPSASREQRYLAYN